MSLNRAEQTVHNYIAGHPDESRYWQDKVMTLAATTDDVHAAAENVAEALAAYCRERAVMRPEFRALETPNRLMLRNLAELFVRRWVPVKPKKSPPVPGS